MKKINPSDISRNPIRMIGTDWMLITAGNMDNYNTMTASWGGVGFLWNRPVAFIFVRPQRYTFEFTESNDNFTLSFFPDGYRKALTLCGSVSGRDEDKVARAGLTPFPIEGGSVSFGEANLILECRKLYGDFLSGDKFIDVGIINTMYPDKDFHKMYVGEILSAWEK